MYSRSGSYTTDKPPYCEIVLRAVSDSTPPDLTVSLTLTGGKLLQPITLERKAEHPSLPLSPKSPPGSNLPLATGLESSEEIANSRESDADFELSSNKEAISESPQEEKDESSQIDSPSPPLLVNLPTASPSISHASSDSSIRNEIAHQDGMYVC